MITFTAKVNGREVGTLSVRRVDEGHLDSAEGAYKVEWITETGERIKHGGTGFITRGQEDPFEFLYEVLRVFHPEDISESREEPW